ncbi:MAG TPA: polyketide cyclase [Actinobacteria bacterium]|nr:polyketide cyclase [Actinomycetota bacterium]
MTMPDERVDHYRVHCVVPASAQAVFAVLADPTRHREFDGADMVRDALDPEPLTAEGQIFRMNMQHGSVGDYTIENHVLIVKPNEEISWMPSAGGRTPTGYWWGYDIRAIDDRSCEVGLNYDWSAVTNPKMRARFGHSNQANMQESLTQLQGLFAQ